MFTLILALAGGVSMSSDTVRVEYHAATDPASGRAYRLVLPSGSGPRPLLIALHGCTQTADDFARGSRFDQRAATERGWVVVYPEQAVAAHPNRCWNWYAAGHQQRDAGEPAMLMAIVDQVIAQHAIDPDRVYLVGISAGGAMAANLAALYPERFAAIGVHSGVPALVANTLPVALQAMQGKDGRTSEGDLSALRDAMGSRARAIPFLGVHGDKDAVVAPSGTERLVAQFAGLAQGLNASAPVEHVVVPALGHAWSGGDAAGTFTDPTSLDATARFLQFFAGQRRP